MKDNVLCKICCFQWFKDTNLKANHNTTEIATLLTSAVSNGSKILIWKQITTMIPSQCNTRCCFQWFKDTNLKANHNSEKEIYKACVAVSNGSKILIWKQITTCSCLALTLFGCFQWFKDTNLKANHNFGDVVPEESRLFPMVQRY